MAGLKKVVNMIKAASKKVTTKAVKVIAGINPTVPPSGTGCVECLKMGKPQWWLHLRRCAECGHIGCCNDSPNQHGKKHFHETGHPIIQSFEPGEKWFYDWTKDEEINPRVKLADPQSHPKDQPIPFYVK